MRFLPTALHGILDYLMGITLMIGPWLLGWNRNVEMWIPMAFGGSVIAYSLLTNYECGFIGVFPMAVHLAMDVVGGFLLATSPWAFGFSERIWLPHVVFGAMEVAAGLITKLVPSHGPKMTNINSDTH